MNPVFSAPEIGYLRSRYSARDILIPDPCTPVFRARVASVPAGPTYLQIPFNTVSLGAYTDIRVDQTVIVSATADHTLNPLWEGRVADAATSSVLPINESAFPLLSTFYITVLDTYKPLPRVRAGALVDGRKAFQRNPPTITGVPSASFKESDSTESFTLTALGQPTEVGASIASYSWSILGTTYTTASVTFDVPSDTHLWGHLTVTDSLSTPQTLHFQVINKAKTNSTLPTQSIDGLTINRTWAGQHASARAYRNVTVSSVMNGTRVVIASIANLRGGSVDLDPVRFVGYLTKEVNSTNSAFDKSVQFDIASIWERATQLPLNPIAIRDAASPTKWDELNLPTTQRVANHILARYSTVLNLCCLNLDETDSTWYGGEMNVDSTSIGDAIKDLLSEINAEIIAAPSGELFLRRDLRFESDANRDAADTIWEITRADVASVELSTEHYERTGRVIAGFRSFYTARTPSVGAKAVAPAVTLGTSPETQTRANQLLEANLTEAQLLTAAADRVSNILAAENPAYDLGAQGRPALAYLNPNCFQWVDFDLPASTITRGRAITGRHLLTGIEISYDVSGPSHTVRLEFVPESQGGAAFVVAALAPSVSSLSMVITPPMGAYGGNYPTPSSLNSVNGSIPPFDRGDMSGMGPPMPADQAADEAMLNPGPGGRAFAISFAVSTPVAAGFNSALGAPYKIAVVGSAKISDDAWEADLDFTASDHGFSSLGSFSFGDGGSWSAGVGLVSNHGLSGGNSYRMVQMGRTIDSTTITYMQSWFVVTNGVQSPGGVTLSVNTDSVSLNSSTTPPADGAGTFSGSGNVSGAVGLGLRVQSGWIPASSADPGGTVTVTRLLVRGTGTNPFTGDPGTSDLYADAFYQWQLSEEEGEEDEMINVSYLGATAGLFIEGAVAAPFPPPLFSESHIYSWDWEGTGNNPEFKFQDPNGNWADNDNKLLLIAIEGPGAGT